MRRMKLIIIITLLTLKAFCPSDEAIRIIKTEPIRPHNKMLYSFQKIESNFNETVVNWLGYTGMLQIGQEMTDEANRLCKLSGNPKRFTFPKCALDSLQSTQIFFIVQDYHNPSYDLRRACFIWNPLASVNYYNKINKVLKSKL